MSEGENSVASRNATQLLLPDDIRKLKKLSDYADAKNKDIQKMSCDFTNMGVLRLLWDSKVPEKDRWFFHCFSLTVSNRDEVLKEIEKFQKFYEELSNAVCKVKNPENQTETEREDPHGTIILELKEKLLQMHEAAKLGKEKTASSAIYRLQKSFIERHEALEDMITGVESVALKEGYKKAVVGWKKSIQSIKVLDKKLNDSIERNGEITKKLNESKERNDEITKKLNDSIERNDEITKKLNDSKEENDQMSEKLNYSIERNNQITEKLNDSIERNDELTKKLNDSIERNDEITKKMHDSIVRNDQISVNFECLMSLHTKLMVDQKKLLNENEKMVENQKCLMLKNQKMQEEIEKLQKKSKELDK